MNLSSDIYCELLSWLEGDDQRAFVMVNRMISSQMMKYVRVLCLKAWWGEKLDFEQRFRSYLTSEKLQNLIADPYNQLTLGLPGDLDLEAAGFDDISISCKSLSISVDQLTTSFIHCIKKVQKLTLNYYRVIPPSLTEVQTLTNWMNNSNLGLKQLEIDNYDITNLPVIPSLESLTIANTDTFNLNELNISAYSNLRCLKLVYLHIEDVSSLDGIHELHLIYSNGIRDISCLNHNYKIVIEECNDITDYSNSFRYSKIIHISCPPNFTGEPNKTLNLSKAHEARKIYVGRGYHKKPLLLPQTSTLREVQVDFTS